MKLYDVPDNNKIRLLENPVIPPASVPVEKEDILLFYHIDGMYGSCENADGYIVYIAGWTEVEVVE